LPDLLIIAGTRPEVVKLAPLVKALRKSHIKCEFVLSGQHPDLAMDVLPSLNLEQDERLVGIRRGSLDAMEASLADSIGYYLRKSNAKCVLALGDTSTALVASRMAFVTRKRFFHVEAGLRTSNKLSPFPEEQNRRTISQYAEIHFAPSVHASNNLKSEGIDHHSIHVVGSTFIEAFNDVREIGKTADFFLSNNSQGQWDFLVHGKVRESQEMRPSIPSKAILFTSHRRENIPEGIEAVSELALRVTRFATPHFDHIKKPHFVIWPVHPNPDVDDIIRPKLKHKSRIKLTRSLQYHEMAWLLEHVDVIVTDSAGVMEEASILGIPTVVARTETERPELFENSSNLLLANPCIEDLSLKLARALKLEKTPVDPTEHAYGGSPASEKIVAILEAEILK
jgi:UDP-N-acetylglucosamine 2-epimerase (non-hydrolysing)